MKYKSTRGDKNHKSASQAILKGIADDGGLYVPEVIPSLDKSLEQLVNLTYHEIAFEILKVFLTDYTEDELKFCINSAYDEKFDTKQIAPLAKVGNDYFLELFHGKTLAFKDMALSILPYLLTIAAKKNNLDKEIVILTATSGDTGKASLEGFKDVDGTKIIVFYPESGVSKIQQKQMLTTEGNNTYVYGVYGNFDDTQTYVKKIFTNTDLNKKLYDKGYVFSSANSINIGRLLPQIVYYFYAYKNMVQNNYIQLGEKINFTVPTGNFGNILAGYFAKELGLPINKLICASNENKVLYDFFKDGIYNINREFYCTSSPSMDIIISSNLERLIYFMSDEKNTRELFKDLSETNIYKFTKEVSDFVGEFSTDEEASVSIKEVFEKHSYVMDTHTAVAHASYKKYVSESHDDHKNIIVSTASPYKFSEAVCSAIDKKYENKDAFELIHVLSNLSKTEIPNSIKDIENKKVMFDKKCTKEAMQNEIENLLF